MASIDIKVDIIKYINDDSYNENILEYKIYGKNINYILVNTLRRVILSDIPIYAYTPSLINITKNSSVYNNNILKNRIELLPIYNLNNTLDFKFYDNLCEFSRNKDSAGNTLDNTKSLNIYLKKKNIENYILNVTTNDCEFYMNSNKIKNIYKKPLLLCKLKSKEELEFSAMIDLGIPLNHARYSCVSICYYNELNDNSYKFKLSPVSQLDGYEIMLRSCKIIIYNLEKILKKLINIVYKDNSVNKIVLENYDHTYGNLISSILQKNNNIEYCSYRMDHLFIRNIIIEFKIKGNIKFNIILKNNINKLIKYFELIHSLFKKKKNV
mgnify:CR=1 FL=1